MVKMRKKLSSAVRGFRKLGSKQPLSKVLEPTEIIEPSLDESTMIQRNTEQGSEQGRDVDMEVVERKVSVANSGERDDVDEIGNQRVSKLSEIEETKKSEAPTANEDDKEDNDVVCVTPSISTCVTETDVELELTEDDQQKSMVESLIDTVEEEDEEKNGSDEKTIKEDEIAEVKEDGSVTDGAESETEAVDTDVSPETVVSEKVSKDERDIEEENEKKQAEDVQSVVENRSGDEIVKNTTEEETSVKKEEENNNNNNNVAVPEDNDEPVMEDVPLDTPEQIAELPKTPEPSREDVCCDENNKIKVEESKCNILPAPPVVATAAAAAAGAAAAVVDPSADAEVIPRTPSSRSMPKMTMKVDDEKIPPLAFCCF